MTQWILHIPILFAISYLVFRLIQSDLPGWIYWTSLILKLVAGICLGLIYFEFYGSGDTITYFNHALNSITIVNQPRTQFFLLILEPIVTFSGGSYWVSACYLSFISFIGFWCSAFTLSNLYPKLKWVITISFLFIPSILFWSSGISKESIAIPAFVLLVVHCIKFYRTKLDLQSTFLILASALLLFQLKHYLLITSLLFAGILFASMFFQKWSKKWKALSFLILFGAIIATQLIHPYLLIERIPWTLHQNNQTILKNTEKATSSGIEINEESWFEILRNVPQAIQTGLFRPSVFDKVAHWGIIHQVENLVLTFLFILSLLLYLKKKVPIDLNLLFAASTALMVLAIALALATPNFGSLVRYKTAYLPFLFLLFSILPSQYLAYKSPE